jgi:hypothetical protein
VGGLVATIAMTALMLTMGDDSPPPTALLWAKVTGGDPEEAMMPGMVLHLLYGVIAGGVLAAVALAGLLPMSVGSLVGGLVTGVVYGLVLFVVAAVVWMRGVLGMEPEMQQAGGFLLFHLVYGVVLGGFLGLGLLG